MTAAIGLWGVLAIVVAVLLIYRYSLTSREDDTVHLEHETAKSSDQAALATKVGSVDRWGKILTVVVAAYGLALIIYWISITALSSSHGM
jgi:hypothetical protein